MPLKLRKTRFPVYLLPIIVGMGGVLFSIQIDSPVWRRVVMVLSVAAPLFAGGAFLSRLRGRRLERGLIVAGGIMLALGAVVSVSDFSVGFFEEEVIPSGARQWAFRIGLLSLLVGIGTIFYTLARTDEAIEAIAGRFWLLADKIHEGFLVMDANGVVLLVNRPLLDMLGFERDQLIGQRARDLTAVIELNRVATVLKAGDNDKPFSYITDQDVEGELRHFTVSSAPIRDNRGTIQGVLAIIHDTTELSRLTAELERYAAGLEQLAEEQNERLRESQEEMRSLLVRMNEGFVTVDERFRIHFANNRFEAMLGVDEGDLIGHDLFSHVEPASRGRLLSIFELTQAASELRTQQEVHFMRQGVTPVAAVVALSPIETNEPGKPHFSLVVTDVTELKRMQHQLEVRAEELQRVNEELLIHDRAKDTFLSTVGHELRTPLSTIAGYLEMLTSGELGALTELQASSLGVMNRNANRLRTLIEEMLAFSRMELRGIDLEYELFSPARLADECVRSAHPDGLAKDVSINVFYPEDVPLCWGDRMKIGQVLTNFLSNAIKFSNPGGRVDVRVECDEDLGLRFSVQDTGIGIAPDDHKAIFSRFYQVDHGLARRYEGTGIGLSVAKGIAEAHGGEIMLESALGQGSTFTLHLPQAVYNATLRDDQRGVLVERHVLLALEREVLGKLFSESLQAAGAVVSVCRTVEDAVQASGIDMPDVVVTDQSTGTTVQKELMLRLDAADLPMVVLCQAADGYDNIMPYVIPLNKPFDAAALVTAARDAVHGAAKILETPDEAKRVVLLIERDRDLLDWMSTALQTRGIPTLGVTVLEQAHNVLERLAPIAVAVDVDVPGTNPRTVLSDLRQALDNPDVPIIALTAFPSLQMRHVAVNAVLTKPFPIGALEELVRSPEAD